MRNPNLRGIETLRRNPVNTDPLRDTQLEEPVEEEPHRYDRATVDAMFDAFDAIMRVYLSDALAGTIHNSVSIRLNV